MYEYENNQMAEQEIKLPEDNINISHQNIYNEDNRIYTTLRENRQTYINNNSGSFCNRTSPRVNKNFIYNRKLNNIIPHHHHHIYRIHHHCHSPCLTNTLSKSRSCSCSCSPSPIKNISQPLINPNCQIQSESSNHSKLIYVNENSNSNMNNIIGSNAFSDNNKSNDYMDNIYTKKINDVEISKNNNSFINNNNNEELNHFNAMAFDEYMSKIAMNKYNRMKQYNESYYLNKQFGEDINKNYNYKYINNNDNNLDELKLLSKNLEEKYKLYNLITKYDEMNFNQSNENLNKEINDQNSKEINIEESNNYDKEINSKRIIHHHKHHSHHKKHKNNKKNSNNKKVNIKKINISENKYHKNIEDYSSSSKSESENESESSIDKNKNDNILVKDDNNQNIIQKAFNEKIGQDNNNNFVYSSNNNNQQKKPQEDKNINTINNMDMENKKDSNLLEYLKKENEELKRLNNSYKQTLDTLFYFLNNICSKYLKPVNDSQNNSNSHDLFDISKDLNNIEGLSKKLINLESLINEDNNTNPNNKNDKDNYNINDKNKNNNGNNNINPNDKNNNNNNKNNKNINKNNNKNNNNVNIIDNNNNYKYINNNNKKKINPLLLAITKENSIQLPKLNNLEQFNDIIGDKFGKCFTFQNDNYIERYKKDDGNNNKNDDKIKNKTNIDNNKDIDNELTGLMSNDCDRCVACLLGCNISKRGYSPMRYSPYNKKELRLDDSGELLDRYNELREKANKENENAKKKINIKNKNKIPKNMENSKKNSLNNSRSNNSMKTKKKIWK